MALAALEKKAEQIRILDLTKLDTVTDYFVICTGDVNQQVKAIASHVERSSLEKLGEKPIHSEGYDSLNWVLIDFVDVVVHVFRPTTRDYYRLEDLWSDADVIDVTDDGEFVVTLVNGKTPKSPAKKSTKKSTKKAAKKKAATKKTPAKKATKKSVKKAKKAPGTSVSRTRPKKSVKKSVKKTTKKTAPKGKAKKA